ncbi:MAG TPA: hypothetical protein VK212_09400 [Lentimicrobium sp.]|nr:hypothetical protein [Lentimicrobium sp.]
MLSELGISNRQIKAALKSEEASAKAARLIYVNDTIPGIERKRIGNKFKYYFKYKEVTDTETLLRIKNLSIPPAWEKVWICANPQGHLQVTGFDQANRKQYRYHPSWNVLRSHTKYFRLFDFGLKLPLIRSRIDADLKKPGLTREKVLALVISILDTAFIRIGNSIYEKLNGSYGLTTLKNKHVKIDGTTIRFNFIGKKGIKTNASIKSKRLSNIVRMCREIPGKQLFGYINEEGIVSGIDSGMVNNYLKEISSGDFTAKDFRTWAGSVSAIRALRELGPWINQTDLKRKINLMYDMVANDLGNTRNVCKKHENRLKEEELSLLKMLRFS